MTTDYVLHGDVRKKILELPTASVEVILTSPPYWGLKDYGEPDQLGQEATVEEYIANLVGVFSECKRVLVPDGLLFLNLGDVYFGYWGNSQCGDSLPPSSRCDYNENKRPKFEPRGWQQDKQKALIPHRVAIALQDDGWIIRNDAVWHKPNYRRERVQFRLDTANEYWFICCLDPRTKRFRKHGRLRHDLLTYNTTRVPGHHATFPLQMIIDILSQCDYTTVLDPFMGSGTTAQASHLLGKHYIGIEVNGRYIQDMALRV